MAWIWRISRRRGNVDFTHNKEAGLLQHAAKPLSEKENSGKLYEELKFLPAQWVLLFPPTRS